MAHYRDDEADARRRAQEHFSTHLVLDGEVRSFRLQAVKTQIETHMTPVAGRAPRHKVTYKEGAKLARTGTYTYSLTWSPGQLVLTGDCGDMTLTHYHAMPTFEEAVRWASGDDLGYLLGKSNKKQVLNVKRTIANLREEMTRPIVEEAVGYRRNAYRKREDGTMEPYQVQVEGLLHETRRWLKSKAEFLSDPDYSEEENLAAWQGDKPQGLFTWRRKEWPQWRYVDKLEELSEYWEIPDVWMPWVLLWWRNQGKCYSASFTREEDHPTCVTKAHFRRWLWEEEVENCESGEALYDLYHDLGFDADFSYDYTWSDYFQAAAIVMGMRKIGAQLGMNVRGGSLAA